MISPFWRLTLIGSPEGTGPEKKLPGIVTRSIPLLINVVGTGAPLTTAWLVEKKLVPKRYTSCCADPSSATVGCNGMFVLKAGSVAVITVTVDDAAWLVSATAVAVMVIELTGVGGAK